MTIGHNSEGFIELLQKSFCEFKFDLDLDFPLNIEHRGIEGLPNYHFRDDGLNLWNAIKEYVTDIINIFYMSDEDVQQDLDIQDWIGSIYR